MRCTECGFENAEGAAACTRCGKPLDPSAAEGSTVVLPPDAPREGDPHGATLAAPPATPSGTDGWSVAVQPGATAGGSSGLQPGAVLAGRYEIVKILGEGGMGTVYQARDVELERPVALKLVRPDLASHPEVLQRFKQELILAREVTHPNVVRIFDLATAGGLKFITMEYVAGRDLKSLMLEGRKFEPEEITAITRQVSEALAAAHDAGVVHRDLKPQNIMIDREGRAKVMDFGVARSMAESGMTRTGQLIGTPDYMSPEQAKGEHVDARSDLFSLGIIVYELLTGKVPYTADTTFGALLKRTQEPAVPPAKRAPGVPRYLNDVVVRCLQIDPDLRYRSAREIVGDLDARQASRPMLPLAAIRSRVRRASPAVRWSLLAVGAVLVVLAGLALSGRIGLTPRAPAVAQEPDPISLAILPFRNATGDPAIDWLQSSLAEMLRSDIGQSRQLRTVPQDRVEQILSDLKLGPGAALDAATIGRLGQHSNARMVVSGQYSKVGERIRIDATVHDLERGQSTPIKSEARDESAILEAIDELAGAVREKMDLSSDDLRRLEAASFTPSSDSVEALRHYNDGLRLERQGNYVEALAEFESSTEADPDFALAYSRLGQAYSNLGRDGEGERASRRAVELSESLPDYERYVIAAAHAIIVHDYAKAIESYERLSEAVPEDPEINFQLAGLYEQTGALDAAQQRLEKVLKYDPNYVDALYSLGRVEIMGGDPQAALDPLNRALTLTVQAGNDDGRGRMLNAIGIAYMRLGKLDEALRHYRDSLEIRKRLDQKSGIAASLSEIARIQQMLGQYDQAQASLEQALDLRRAIGDRAGIGASLIGLGGFHLDLGHNDEALGYYKESLRVQREIGNEMDEAVCLNNIGLVYLEQGEFGDALTNFEQALGLREKADIPYEMGETLHNLGETAAAMGQYDQAVDYYLRALEQMRAAQNDLGVAAALHGMGVIQGFQGRFHAALESIHEAAETLEAGGEQGYWRAVVTASHGAALGAVGRFEEAAAELDRAEALAREAQNPALVAQVLDYKGDLQYRGGDTAAAGALYDEALREASAASDRRTMLLSKLDVAKIDVREKRAGKALGVLGEVAGEAERLGLAQVAAEAALYLAEAALDQGDTAAARRRLEGALTVLERSQMRALLARCRWLWGRLEQAEGNPQASSRHYAQARKLLEDIRQEAGDDDPLRRDDLATIYAAVR